MVKKRARKPKNQPVVEEHNCHKGVPLEKKEDGFKDKAVERQHSAIRALRDVEIDQFRTMLQLIRSYFSKEQLQIPVLQFFNENLLDISLAKTGKDGQYEAKWKDRDGNLTLDHADEKTLHAALLNRLPLAYSDFSAGIPSFGGFDFSNQSVKTCLLGPDKLQIRSLVFDEPSDSQVRELKDNLQTPNVNNNRLSVGITPKTKRLPKSGEMLLSVHGSPLGVYKEDIMETIHEAETWLNWESQGCERTIMVVLSWTRHVVCFWLDLSVL